MATDRELDAWERIGRVAAIALVEEVARLLNDAPPGGFWGRELKVEGWVLVKAEAAFRAHVERILFQHPSWAVTGGSCAFDEEPVTWVRPGEACVRVTVRWPRFEDSPIMKGAGGPPPRGISFSPDLLPAFEVPRSILQDGWQEPRRVNVPEWKGDVFVRGAEAVEPCSGCGAVLPDPRQGFERCPECDRVACSPLCLARHRRDRHEAGGAP